MEIQEVANALMKMDEQGEAPVTPAEPIAPVVPPVEVPPVQSPAEAPPQEPAEETPPEEDEAATIKASAADLARRLKAAEREQDRWHKQANYWMQAFQTRAPEPTKPDPPPPTSNEPSPYPPKPVLAQFNDYDEYVENLTDWKLQKREIDASINIQRSMQQRQQQEVQSFINTRMAEGLKQYPEEFWSRADEVGHRITEDMRRAIFKSDNFAQLVMHLGKNLAEVERIATIPDPDDRTYELKSIAKRIKAEAINLKQKEQSAPPVVEKPGVPANRPILDERKAIQKASETGNLRDWAKVIELREATPKRP